MSSILILHGSLNHEGRLYHLSIEPLVSVFSSNVPKSRIYIRSDKEMPDIKSISTLFAKVFVTDEPLRIVSESERAVSCVIAGRHPNSVWLDLKLFIPFSSPMSSLERETPEEEDLFNISTRTNPPPTPKNYSPIFPND